MAEYCYRHHSTETGLRCGNCDRPICVQCVVHHPVGIRCEECAWARKIPIFDVTPVYYARAVAAAVGIGVGGVIGLVQLSALLAPMGQAGFYLGWLTLVGIGYLMGSGVSWATNRKRGRGLQWVAGVGVVVVFLVLSPLLGLSLNSLFGLLALGAAVCVAVNQLRV